MTSGMGWVTGIAVFVTIWWVVIFVVLPWGVRAPDHVETGHASGAPSNPQLGRKALITTAISIVIWLGIEMIVRSELISFREMVR
jgi:predicted secreted protein